MKLWQMYLVLLAVAGLVLVGAATYPKLGTGKFAAMCKKDRDPMVIAACKESGF